MVFSNKSIVLSEEDLKEVFSLFSSVSVYEKEQLYDENNLHYFLNVKPLEEYSLTEEKREYALDAWRAVTYFLFLRGYSLCKDSEKNDLSFSKNLFVG